MLVRGSGAGCGLADSLNQLTSGGGRGDLLSGVDVVPKHGGVRAGRVGEVPEDRNEGAAVSWPRRGNTTQRQQNRSILPERGGREAGGGGVVAHSRAIWLCGGDQT